MKHEYDLTNFFLLFFEKAEPDALGFISDKKQETIANF